MKFFKEINYLYVSDILWNICFYRYLRQNWEIWEFFQQLLLLPPYLILIENMLLIFKKIFETKLRNMGNLFFRQLLPLPHYLILIDTRRRKRDLGFILSSIKTLIQKTLTISYSWNLKFTVGDCDCELVNAIVILG